jgi:hypothetical protein
MILNKVTPFLSAHRRPIIWLCLGVNLALALPWCYLALALPWCFFGSAWRRGRLFFLPRLGEISTKAGETSTKAKRNQHQSRVNLAPRQGEISTKAGRKISTKSE